MTAARLDGLTQYLVDVKEQFAGHDDHLGMVDRILDTLVHHQAPRPRTGSARDPEDALTPRLSRPTAASVRGRSSRRRTRRTSARCAASVSMVMCGGTWPICLPALKTQVRPRRACHDPPLAHGAWWMCPQRTTSGWCCSIQAASSWSGNSRRPSRHSGGPGRRRVVDPHPASPAGRRPRRPAGRRPPSRVSGPSHHGHTVKRTPSTSVEAPSTCTRSSARAAASRPPARRCGPGPSRSWLPDDASTSGVLGQPARGRCPAPPPARRCGTGLTTSARSPAQDDDVGVGRRP